MRSIKSIKSIARQLDRGDWAMAIPASCESSPWSQMESEDAKAKLV